MANSMKKVLVLPGDNIGPEIIAEAVRVLVAVNEKFGLGIELDYAHLGGAALDAVGEPCPQETLDKARAADAILLGAVGGPQWDDVERHLRPEKGLLTIRSELELFGNLRPAIMYSAAGSCLFTEAGVCLGFGYFDCSRVGGWYLLW